VTEPTLSRRRQDTRRRLLDAAGEVFAEQGFGSTTVEQVCQRADFTRGAFYSNFASLDELFLAMWEQRSTRMLADFEGLLREVEQRAPRSVRDVVQAMEEVSPVDDAWYRVTAEFTAHALRHPSLKRVMAAREEAIAATLIPIIDRLLGHLGRRITDPAALGPALVAVHDGTTVQCLIEEDQPAARARRAALFALLIEHYSEEIR
jgi:AcrR family transcriptional regulator